MVTTITVLVGAPKAARRETGRQEAGIQPMRPPSKGWEIQSGRGRLFDGTTIRPMVRMLTALIVLVAAAAFTPAARADEAPTMPPFPAGTVGVVGCSNAAQHVQGYLEQSTVDQMPRYALGGLSFEVWGDPASANYASAWGRYTSARPAAGYQAAWVMMCIKADDAHDPNLLLTEVVGQVHLRDPGIPVFVSPINEYGEGHVCSRIGPDGFAVGLATVAWGAANLGITAGPTTGPLSGDLISADGCHLSGSGIDLVGGQMVDWFDEGGWEVPDDTVPPTAPTGLQAIAVAPGTVDLTWVDASDDVAVDHYLVERDAAVTGVAASASFTDTAVPAGTHAYVVYAVDAAGNVSAPSAAVTVTVAGPSSQLTATPTKVAVGRPVTFTDANAGSHRRVISYGDGGGAVFRTQAVTHTYGAPGVYAVTLDTVSLDTGQRAVLAVSVTVVAAVPDTTPPAKPGGLVVGSATHAAVSLSWTAAIDDVGVAHYVVVRDSVDLTTTTATSHSDATVAPSATYQYRVAAVDAAGNRSEPSDPVTVTTPAPPDVPSSQLTATPNPAVVGQPVVFTDAHPGGHRRSIDFGDGSKVSGRSPTFTRAYPAAGVYVVTLETVAVAGGQRATFTVTVVVTGA